MPKLHKSAWWLAAASGGLQVLIFPTPDLHWLCWIALVPLLVALLRSRPAETISLPESFAETRRPATAGQAFLLGWWSGIVWSAGSCYWVYSVMHLYGGLSAPIALGVLALFSLALGAHMGVFALLISLAANGFGTVRASTRRALVFAPFAWVTVEFARTMITGFPWNLLGTVQVNNIPLTRLATATGVYGLSFEILLVNTAFAAAWLMRHRARRLLLTAAIMAAVALQVSEFIQPPPLAAGGTALLVQQNIPLVRQWSSEVFQQTMDELRQKSLPPPPAESRDEPTPDLVVWPESPAPFYQNDPQFRAMISQIAVQARAYLIIGMLGVDSQSPGLQPRQIFNSAELIAPDGRWMARYDKIHLVPFGEYVPFKRLLGFARQLTSEVGDFVPGSRRNVFELGRYKVGTFICYESIFPGEVRRFAANGAQVFANISNDEWFGRSAAPEQHLNQARMRAIENRRWLLRSTNTGITASIDPFGRIVDQAPRDVLTALNVPFGIISATTFYTRHGDWFCWVCVIISLVALLAGIPALRRVFARRKQSRE